MYRPLSLFIGLRYLNAKRRNHFISFISVISSLGVALGVVVLITVLSVMNGFEKEIRNRILGAAAHATISGLSGGLTGWEKVIQQVDGNKNVIGAAPYVHGEAMISAQGRVQGSIIRGVVPSLEPSVSELSEKMLVGDISDLSPGQYNVILGNELALKLGVVPGDKITLIVPKVNVTPVGLLPRVKRFTVVGIFRMGMFEYDSSLALTHIDDLARLKQMKREVTGVRLKVNDIFVAPKVARELANDLPGLYRVRDWTQDHANYFRAVSTEKRVMFIILMLIVSVAAFNIVSTMVMMVTDKTGDIAILKTMGVSSKAIIQIFMVQGTAIGVVGTILGAVGGVTLALNVETIVPFIERSLGVAFFDPSVYYISDIPSDMHWSDVWTITGISLLMSIVATIYPAWRASKVQPAEVLRYE